MAAQPSSPPVAPSPSPTVYAAVAAAAGKRAKEAPSGTESLPVAHKLTYSWEYACERPDLRILYEKSKDLLWNARTVLAWDTPVDPTAENVPDEMNRRTARISTSLACRSTSS